MRSGHGIQHQIWFRELRIRRLPDPGSLVMYDAMGVRRETGIQAKLLNEMMAIFAEMRRKEASPDEKLKEFLGHTPLQVLEDALLGILIAFPICRVIP